MERLSASSSPPTACGIWGGLHARRIVDDMLNLLPDEVWSVFPRRPSWSRPAVTETSSSPYSNGNSTRWQRRGGAGTARRGGHRRGASLPLVGGALIAVRSRHFGRQRGWRNAEHPLGTRENSRRLPSGWLRGPLAGASRLGRASCSVRYGLPPPTLWSRTWSPQVPAAPQNSSFDVPLVEYEWNPRQTQSDPHRHQHRTTAERRRIGLQETFRRACSARRNPFPGLPSHSWICIRAADPATTRIPRAKGEAAK